MISSYIDVTAPITRELVKYPGDPEFECQTVSDLNDGDVCGLVRISMCNHFGTHIDFPAHVIKGGKNSSDYSIADLIFTGLLVSVPEEHKAITLDFIRSCDINPGECVLFKTSNSKLSKHAKLVNDFVYIENEAAGYLCDIGVSMVGIDYISVDSIQDDGDDTLPTHNRLLSQDVLVVENLVLDSVDPGRYRVYVAPINIPDMDGLPARVFLEKL